MCAADLERVMAIAESLKEAPHWPRTAYELALDPDATPRRIALVAEETAEGLGDLKGRGYSCAVKWPPKVVALAAEAKQGVENTFPRGLKPEILSTQPTARLKPRPFKTTTRPFKTANFFAPDKSSPSDGELEGGLVLGFLIASLLPPQAELETIAVAAEGQRRGVGENLFWAMVDDLKAEGASEAMLEVRASNLRAIGFYRVLGWSETGRRPRYYADPEEDAVLMGLRLE
jgi:ribosomal-protein-alanine N-acetyltransferase